VEVVMMGWLERRWKRREVAGKENGLPARVLQNSNNEIKS
jgi:hypothetical protein